MASEQKSNEFGENEKSHKMDLQSRTAAALGVDTMKNLSSLTVLIIGLRGVGVETAKNLILTGPKNVTLYDEGIAEIADMGANFYLTEEHCQKKLTRSQACVDTLRELNLYCDVQAYNGELDEAFIQSFGAVVITQTLPEKELIRINQICRNRKDAKGNPIPVAFIIAVNHGVTAHFFSDFGSNHVVTDADGEPARVLVVDEYDTKNNVITVAAKRHGFDDGDEVLLEDIESVGQPKNDEINVSKLNGVKNIFVKRMYYKYDFKRSDGKIEKRERQYFNQLQLDLSKTEYADKKLVNWKTGGIVNEVKRKKTMKFRSFQECLDIPANDGLAAFFGPQHPDQGAWEKGAGKTIHLLYCTALKFQEQKGFFPRLHNEEDSREFLSLFNKINKERKESNKDGVTFVENIDELRINAYSWYFATELTGYCAFLGGVAAQEVVKKFGKYTPVFQWLHSDHVQFISDQIPSDAIPQNCRYDHQISIFGKSFQYKISNQKIFLVGTGALGCEYLKGLALMGVGTGSNGKVWCTDMDRIEISNLSRQFLFRNKHVGQPKSTTAANSAKQMNPSFNVEALEMKVWPETEDFFDDEFWDNLDLCWNALDNVHARKYTDGKCLFHGKPLLESGTQGTKCNSEVIIPYKTKSYNDGEEQETEGIPMCTLQNFPYLPVHCIEWARSSFADLFETKPKNFNTFFENSDKYFEQINAASDAKEKKQILCVVKKFIDLQTKKVNFEDCVQLAFDEFCQKHILKIKDLIHLFPEDEVVRDKITKEVIGKFWTGHKKFPVIPKIDLNDNNFVEYLFTASNLWAFVFNLKQIRDKKEFVTILKKCNLSEPQWTEPVGLKIKVDENDEDENDEDGDTKMNETDEKLEKEINDLIKFLKNVNKSTLYKLSEVDFEKDDDNNFHIDYITACANTRARNYRIKETSRHRCKIIAGKIIAALATTTAMICGLVELEFYKLKLGLGYINESGFYNANINLAVSQFQFFQPDAAIRNVKKEEKSDITMQMETIIPYPNQWTTWDKLVVDEPNLTVQEFADKFPKIFNGITINLLFKSGKMEKGQLLYDSSARKKNTTQEENQLKRTNLSENMRNHFQKELNKKLEYNKNFDVIQGRNEKLIDRYIKLYGDLVSNKRKYIVLDGDFEDKDGNIAVLPKIQYIFK